MPRKYIAILLVTVSLSLAFFPAPNHAHAFSEAASDPFAELWDHIDGYPSMQPLTYALYIHFAGQNASTDSKIYHNQECLDLAWLLRNSFFYGDSLLLFTSYLTPEEQVAYGVVYDMTLIEEDVLASIKECRWEGEAEYDFIPIAKDALVFMTSIGNPITDLSQDDLRRIYTGQITNWYQLGGEDAEIEAYQHDFSAAQVIFRNTLMRGLQPMEEIRKWFYFGNGEPGDMTEGYDNGLYSIGFARYFSTTGNYQNEEARILSVDGIIPTPQTISSGAYPLYTLCYAVLPKGDARSPLAEELVLWLLTEEGQRVVQSAGYIPLNEADCMDAHMWQPPFPSESTKTSKGSGGVMDRDDELPVYSDGFLYDEEAGLITLNHWWWGWVEGRRLSVTLPWNPELENEINDWCEQTRDQLSHLFSDMSAEAEEYACIYGNLLSFYFQIGDGADTVVETAVFDLKEGKRLALSDLFLDGFNYIDYINNELMIASFGGDTGWPSQFRGEEDFLRRPFSGLPAEYPYFVVTNGMLHIAVQGDNPFFQVSQNGWSKLLLESIPLWHDISPWGGCKIDIRHTATYADPDDDFSLWMDVPILCIDRGKFKEVDSAINAKVESISPDVSKFVGFPDLYAIVPYYARYGYYLSIDFNFFMGGLSIGGMIVDLHTGEPLLTDDEAIGFIASPNARFYQKPEDINWYAKTLNLATRDDIPEGVGVQGMWLSYDSQAKETLLVVDLAAPNGTVIRFTVPFTEVVENQLMDVVRYMW